MTKVLTDSKIIETFLNRGVDKIYPSKDALKTRLMSGERIRVYQGFDPTGPHLHIGHAMGIRALRLLQQLGHEVIFLVGDFTSKVGDPDKDVARRMLSDDEIEKNMSQWKKQAAQLIDFDGENPVQFKRNYEWLSKLRLEDVINLMSNATVQQMMERDLFAKRLKSQDPIGLQEFIYPLMQGFDGVAMEVDMEMGGSDQTFNMLMGRQLVKSYLGKEKFVRTNKMMNAPDGITISKTKGNGINLGDTSVDIYGKAMSYPDSDILNGLELLTDVPMDKIHEIGAEISGGSNPMQFKKFMAFEIVKTVRGVEEAENAQKHFEKTVQHREVAESDVIKLNILNPTSLVEVLKSQEAMGEEVSSSDIRRMIEQGGVQVNGETVSDIKFILDPKPGTLIKYGKRKYFKIA